MPMPSAFAHRVEVRFRDCDPMGHVNHAVYFSYLEQCRFAFWRHVTGREAGPGAGIILVRAECDYRAPAYFGEALDVHINVAEIGRSSFALVYEVLNAATSQKLADARTVLVSYDYGAKETRPLTSEMRALLERARVQ